MNRTHKKTTYILMKLIENWIFINLVFTIHSIKNILKEQYLYIYIKVFLKARGYGGIESVNSIIWETMYCTCTYWGRGRCFWRSSLHGCVHLLAVRVTGEAASCLLQPRFNGGRAQWQISDRIFTKRWKRMNWHASFGIR